MENPVVVFAAIDSYCLYSIKIFTGTQKKRDL